MYGRWYIPNTIKMVHNVRIQCALLQCEFVTPPSRSGPYSPFPWIWVAEVMLHDLWYEVRKSQKAFLEASILLQHLLSTCSFSESSYHRAQATQRVYMPVTLSRVPANLSHPSQATNMWVKKLPDNFNLQATGVFPPEPPDITKQIRDITSVASNFLNHRICEHNKMIIILSQVGAICYIAAAGS